MLYLSLQPNKYDKLSETGAGVQSEAGPRVFTEKCFIYVRVNVIMPAHCLEVKTRDVSRVLRLIWLRRLFCNCGTPSRPARLTRPTPAASFPLLNVTGCLWSWQVETVVVPSCGALLRQSTYCVKRWQVLRKCSHPRFLCQSVTTDVMGHEGQ